MLFDTDEKIYFEIGKDGVYVGHWQIWC